MRESKGVAKPGGEMKVSKHMAGRSPAWLSRRGGEGRRTRKLVAGSVTARAGRARPPSRRCVNWFRGAGRGLVAKRPRGLEPRDPAGKYLRAHSLGPERW